MNHEELLAIQEQEQKAQANYRFRLHVCAGTGCISSHSEEICQAFAQQVKERGLEGEILVKRVGCMGLCAAGPIVQVAPEGLLYKEVTPEDVPAILDSLGKAPVAEKLIPRNIPFFYRQEKVVLENSGQIDPERIEDYLAVGGYQALMKAVTELEPADVIQEVVSSGLRGRGGGGYPTGLKWTTVAKTGGDLKYVICNGDEGDPGAFMDRSIMESDPHLVIEGMAIAAYAVGASQGVIYIRAEYPLAIKRLRTALRQAEKYNFLGKQICGSSFSLHIELRLGAGAFVCGEETALMRSIEGNRGTPRPRPPYPAQSGLNGCPTLINNVETLANIPNIVLDGGKWFGRIGSEKSKGTKVFALTGKINNTGLIEVPMGIPLRDIIFEIGGGVPEGHRFKAIQTGGPSGGCIPESLLDTPVDYESLKGLGSIMGSGGMIVIDDTSNMIDVARYLMEFSMEESCGKCVPCRSGVAQIYTLLNKFSAGDATAEDLATLEDLCDVVQACSLCGLGQSAPNPVLSTLRYFRDEYLARLRPADPELPVQVEKEMVS